MHIMLFSLKRIRDQFGLSQIGLAHESGVSLPTIQNIEADKANPTIEIIEKLLTPLGLKLELVYPVFDVHKAMLLGVPITLGKTIQQHPFFPNVHNLKIEVRSWQFLWHLNILSGREKDAMRGFMLALSIHYKSIYQKISPQFWDEILSEKINGRIIKLSKIALGRISEYL